MEISIPVIRSKISNRFQYTTSFSFSFIKKHLYLVDDSKQTMDKLEKRGLSKDELSHKQRTTNMSRGREIAKSINQGDFFLPSILCIFKNGTFVANSASEKDNESPTAGILHISTANHDFFYCADGQHRIAGIQLSTELNDNINHINANIIQSESDENDRQVSVDINVNAKKYDKSLARTMCNRSILNIMAKDILSENLAFKTLVNCSSNSTSANSGYFYSMESIANFIMNAMGLTEKEIQNITTKDARYVRCKRAISLFLNLLSTDFSLIKTAIDYKNQNNMVDFKKAYESTILKTNLFISSLGQLCYLWITKSILENKIDNEIGLKLNGIDIGFHYDLVDRAYDINYKMKKKSKESINLTTAYVLDYLKMEFPSEILKSELKLKELQKATVDMIKAK